MAVWEKMIDKKKTRTIMSNRVEAVLNYDKFFSVFIN